MLELDIGRRFDWHPAPAPDLKGGAITGDGLASTDIVVDIQENPSAWHGAHQLLGLLVFIGNGRCTT